MHGYFSPRPHTILKLGAAILTEHTVYDNRHFFVRPATRRIYDSVPLCISQHDVTFELATLLPRTLLGRDICNKTYGNWLCVATGCSSCKNSVAVLVEQLYTGLMGFVGCSSVLSFTATHGGLMNWVNKLYAADILILISIDLHGKGIAGDTGQTTT